MAKPAHHRLTWSGFIGPESSPLEYWSFGLSTADNPEVNDFNEAQMNGLAGGLWTCYETELNSLMATDCHLTETRWAAVGADGLTRKRVDGSFVQGIVTDDLPGSGDPTQMPLEVALCVSLQTPRAGASGKGRFFLPWPSKNVNVVDKRLTVADAEDVRDNVADFLNAVNLIGDQPIAVVSTKGYSSPVTRVRVGRVPDVLRSRRRDQAEGYVVDDLN